MRVWISTHWIFLAGCFSLAMVAAKAQELPQKQRQTPAKVPAAEANPVVPRINAPTMPRTGYARYPWKTDIVATVFWIGEQPTANNPTPNHQSSWDTDWQKNFGGFDDPDPNHRGQNYCPAGFTPGLNPFYIALPYNDCLSYREHKPEAARVIPWFSQKFIKKGKSVLKGQWLAIRYGNRVCYAQWEDCGPFVTDDYDYVFGNAKPKNGQNGGAGIDLSPAVRDYLGISSGNKCSWRFVDVNEVPPGAWRNLGMNNPFVRAQPASKVQKEKVQREFNDTASRLEELKRARDAWFRQNNGVR
jgi:hypothetical protein